MAVNKVIYYGEVLVDMSQVSVNPEKLVEGETALDASGELITGNNPYEKSATDEEVADQSALLDQAILALQGKAAGGGAINTGICTVSVVPSSNTNHYICRETVGSDGSVAYAIQRTYTGNTIVVQTRCDSVMYVLASYIAAAEITDGELLRIVSSQGIVYKTPSIDGADAKITLSS